MKIRNGFVSNSSSSSFIIKLNEIPKSPNDIKKTLNIDGDIVFYDDVVFSTERLCKIVYDDIMQWLEKNENVEKYIEIDIYNMDQYDVLIHKDLKDKYFLLKKQLIKHQNKETNFYDETDKYIRYKKINEYYKKLSNILDNIKDIVIKSIDNKNNFFCAIEYSDNDSIVHSYLEHSDFLDPITLIKINKH